MCGTNKFIVKGYGWFELCKELLMLLRLSYFQSSAVDVVSYYRVG